MERRLAMSDVGSPYRSLMAPPSQSPGFSLTRLTCSSFGIVFTQAAAMFLESHSSEGAAAAGTVAPMKHFPAEGGIVLGAWCNGTS